MTLTFGDAPLATDGDARINYRIDGPEHRMLLQPYPRRMRALVGDRVVVDSTRAGLLHETGALPALYFPFDDFDEASLERSRTTSECPFRGLASHWSLHAGGRTFPDAVWAYENPKPGHEWLRGYAALDFDAPDAWFCEDERLFGHLRDPFHRVDVFESSRRATVRLGELAVASSARPKLLFETGLAPRVYLPAADVQPGLLWPSATRTICPYKGQAWHWTLRTDGKEVEDAAWSYETPLPEAGEVQGHLCFYDSKVTVALEDPPDRFEL